MKNDLKPAEVRRVARLAGHNVYGTDRMVRCELGTSATDAVDDAFLDGLSECVPNVVAVRTCGPSAAVSRAHLFEHLCIELQNLAGSQLGCTRAAGRADDGRAAMVPFDNELICDQAIHWATQAVGELSGSTGFDPRVAMSEFLDFAGRKTLPAQDRMLIKSALARGVPVSHVAGRTFTLGHGCHQQRISATKTSLTNIVGSDLASNKDYSRQILDERGLPVPGYARVYSRRAALAAAEQIGFPVVLKPIFGNMGRGVTVGVENPAELRVAYKRAREIGRAVLVEEMVPGDDFRLLVIDGKLCAAAKRVPGHVVGDGRRSIRELIDKLNQDPRRGHDHNAPLTRLEFDEQAEWLLAKLGYGADSVPAPNEVVFLRRNANLSTGGTSVDVTDDVHPDNRRVAERAARAIGLDIAGVDILTTDIGSSIYDNGGKICEINSRPGIRKHIWPSEGSTRDVTRPIVEMLFPAGFDGRIPTIAVVGSGPADLTAQILAHLLHSAGRRVGLGRNGESYTRGSLNRRGRPLTPPDLIRSVLLDPDVDTAVLQFDTDDVVEHGLGTDAFDMTVVVNAANAGSESSSGPTGLCPGLDLVAGITRGVVIVGASDPLAAALESRCADVQVVRVSGVSTGSIDADAHPATALACDAAHRFGQDESTIHKALDSFELLEGGSTRVSRD